MDGNACIISGVGLAGNGFMPVAALYAPSRPQFNLCVEPASLTEYQGALRAPDASLNCAQAKKLLGVRRPRFSDWLAAYTNDLI